MQQAYVDVGQTYVAFYFCYKRLAIRSLSRERSSYIARGWEHRRSHGKQGGVHAVFIASVGVAFAHVGRSHMASQTFEKERTVARIRSAVSF